MVFAPPYLTSNCLSLRCLHTCRRAAAAFRSFSFFEYIFAYVCFCFLLTYTFCRFLCLCFVVFFLFCSL